MSAEQAQVQVQAQTEAVQGTEGQNSGTTEKVERLSPQFAALARKEKAIRVEAQKIKAEREALHKEREQYKSPGYITKEQLMKNPIGILTENGYSPDQIAQMLLSNDHQPSKQDQTMNQLLAKIEELENKTKGFETQFNDRETKDREQALTQIRNEAKILIDSDPQYETIKASNKIDAVVEHIKQTYDTEGILLSVDEAAKEVEDALVEQAMRLASINKIKEKLMPRTDSQVEQKPLPNQQQQQPIKTLTHDMTSSTAKQQLSAKERVKRAIMRAQGLDPDTGKPIAG